MSAERRSPPAEPILLRTDHDGVATLTLNRPAARHALSAEMIAALRRLSRSEGSQLPDAVAAFGITPRPSAFGNLFRSHPPLEDRIARLQAA